MRTVVRVAAILIFLAVLAPALAAACPLCKEAVPDAPGATSVWRGMYWSILFMVGAPFAMVATMIVAIRRARRRLLADARSKFQASSSKLGAPVSDLKLET